MRNCGIQLRTTQKTTEGKLRNISTELTANHTDR